MADQEGVESIEDKPVRFNTDWERDFWVRVFVSIVGTGNSSIEICAEEADTSLVEYRKRAGSPLVEVQEVPIEKA